jgi:3-hydroxyacyl-[acyl-carrier-protein] dehydratase
LETTLKIKEIFESLPHRYPMLLVDRILDLEPGKRCIGIKNVSINEPFFQGHYPGLPIMPGVLIVEAIAQAGCVMLLREPRYAGKIPLIGAIDNVKFKRQVVPGDQLRSDVYLEWMRGLIGRLKGTATVDGEVACQIEMTFKLVERE